MNALAVSSLALTLAILPAALCAQTVITVPASKDNTLIESSSSDLSNGSGEFLFVGATQQGFGNNLRRTVIAFDLSTVPAGATVISAELTLDMTMTIAGSESVAVHRLVADWGEGTSDAPGQEGTGAPATPGDATWNHTSFPGSFWTSAGGDYDPTASDVQFVGGTSMYTWSSPAMAADVQGWLDSPGSNFGWILIGEESFAPTAKRFASREALLNAPALRLEISGGAAPIPVQGPLGAVVLGSLLLLFGIRRLTRLTSRER